LIDPDDSYTSMLGLPHERKHRYSANYEESIDNLNQESAKFFNTDL